MSLLFAYGINRFSHDAAHMQFVRDSCLAEVSSIHKYTQNSQNSDSMHRLKTFEIYL